MRVCPRDLFAGERYREEAFVDAPIRLEELDFNISAPHMHATCLEALQLQPGHSFLDVGSGCGIVTACAAYLVGRTGLSVGVDVRKAAVAMARDNVSRLAAGSKEYAASAARCKFEVHNIFMPSAKHKGMYDRVHVGASCPPQRLGALLALLKPTGGLLVTPVAPSDLRLVTKGLNGTLTQRTISQVRYSDLEVPSDAEIMLATLKVERKERTALPAPATTYPADVAGIMGSPGSSACGSPSGSSASDQSAAGSLFGSSPEEEGRRLWPKRVAKFLAACSGQAPTSGESSSWAWSGSLGERMALDSDGSDCGSPSRKLTPGDLGAPDCALVGPDWRLPIHRRVLRARCEHFRARCDSGMRDAHHPEVLVPEHFTQAACQTFLHYLYQDELQLSGDPQALVATLHVAHYYGAPRLVALCETALAKELKASSDNDDVDRAEAAPVLLAIADEAGLPRLRACALDYICHHYPAVAAGQAYASLSKQQTDLIAAEACRLHTRCLLLLKEVARREVVPDHRA